jgi:hypothetical protein
MQGFQHLTLWVELLLSVYLACSVLGLTTARAITRAIIFPASALVGIGWHLLIRWSPVLELQSPWTMLPRDQFPANEEEAHAWVRAILVRPSPSLPSLLPVFFLLQLQHNLMPLLPWVEQYFYPEPTTLSLTLELGLIWAFACVWLLWSHLITWPALGRAPYPILDLAWQKRGSLLLVYPLSMIATTAMAVLGHMFRGASTSPI